MQEIEPFAVEACHHFSSTMPILLDIHTKVQAEVMGDDDLDEEGTSGENLGS